MPGKSGGEEEMFSGEREMGSGTEPEERSETREGARIAEKGTWEVQALEQMGRELLWGQFQSESQWWMENKPEFKEPAVVHIGVFMTVCFLKTFLSFGSEILCHNESWFYS